MELRLLRYFIEIVDHGGVARAAESLHVSQPALSQAMRILERQLHVKLFHREGRTIALTDAGRALVDAARQVLAQSVRFEEEASIIAGGQRGAISVVTLPSLAIYPVPAIIARLQAVRPGITVRIAPAFGPDSIINQVRSGPCEIGVGSTAEPPIAHDLLTRVIGNQDFIVVGPRSRGRRGGGVLSRKELAGKRFIVGQQGTRVRSLVEDLLNANIGVIVAVEAGHREAVLPLIEHGVGWAFLPRPWQRQAESLGLAVYELDPPVSLNTWVVARAEYRSHAAEAFLAMADDLDLDQLRSRAT